MNFRKYILRDDLAKDSLIMFLGTSLTNFFNLVYTIFLTRALTPQEFGLFNSLLAILMIFSQFPSAITIAFTRFVSQLYAQENFEKMKKFISLLNRMVFLIGFIIFAGIILFSKPIGKFLKISEGVNFLLLSLLILLSYLSPVPQATLVGMQKFWYISFVSIFSGLAKLFFVFIFIKLMLGVKGALGAFLISSFLSLLLCFYFQNKSLSVTVNPVSENKGLDLKNIYSYFFPVFMVTLGGAAFLNIDIILVKRFFEPFEAGLYSLSQVVGKIVFFFPSAIITAMFPKVANLQAKNQDTKFILKKSILYMFFLSALIASVALIFPEWVLRIIVGKVYKECFPLIRMFSINMVLLSILFVFMNYYLSLDKRRYLYIFLGTLLLEIALISLFHKSLSQVLVLIFISFLFLFCLNLWWVFYKSV
ncbi:MAG: oligosaccharide flippase family protein [Candidatus Omnitrophica bacterium]|nr:oligosaccharide flippase family protein [Candidatus Omnitrophota bacterium]